MEISQINQNTSFGSLASSLLGSSPFEFATALLPFLGGPTGAAKVVFENERRMGNSKTYGLIVEAKYRDFEVLFNSIGKSLQDFGWTKNEVPRSAQAIYKKAEDFFFTNLEAIIKALKTAKVDMPINFQDDPVLMNMYNNSQILGSVTDAFYTDTPNIDYNDQNNGTQEVETETGNILTKKYMGFPIWILVIVGYFILKRK